MNADERAIRQLKELHLLRRLERVVRHGHQPMTDGEPDHRWHVQCEGCDIDQELDQFRAEAA